MLVEACSAILYGAVFLSLILIDFILGHGFVDMFQKIFCKITCFVKRTVKEEAKNVTVLPENPISLPVLFMEILVLSLTIAFLNKYKQFRSKDRIDDLLHESKEALRQTNEFLEKWRLRRVPTEYSYLDEEPQEIKPLRLEVPILHMAIIDAMMNSQHSVRRRSCIGDALTLGTTRSQPERGDAGDTVNITDSTLLSVTSLLDEDLESIPEQRLSEEKIVEETKNIEFRNRTLWDVMEEDSNTLED
ncbi:uncharacterized protein LOC111348936 isoform X2 [Spodoptera litura]|uniref:Uncharacterized protein LOC111348936 isoform X2 n=1 Tax=Spodoptera litura TaxID=69820 RepID=A0A9J7ILQ1_SPOLT|nr:uncharacterized protein LOC111348936 isoform X2 [Spodoptera litura]